MTSREVILEGGSPWGFRMHGGVDVGQPLRISRVNPGSKAAQRGVREGDIISIINNQPTCNLANEEAHSLLRTSSNVLFLGLNQDTSVKRRVHRPPARPVQEQDLQTAATAHTDDTKDSAVTISESLSPLPQRSDKSEASRLRNNTTSTTNVSHESTKSHRTHGGGKNKRNRRTKARKKLLRAQQSICDPVNVEICEPVWEAITEIVSLPQTANASLLLSADALCLTEQVKSDYGVFSKDEIQEIVEYHTSYNEHHNNPKRKAKFKRGVDQFSSSLPRLEAIAEEETSIEEVPINLQDQEQECYSDDKSKQNATENELSWQIHGSSDINSLQEQLQTETDIYENNNNAVMHYEVYTHESSTDSPVIEGQSISPTLNDNARNNVNDSFHFAPNIEPSKEYTRLIDSDVLDRAYPTDVNHQFCLDYEPKINSPQEKINENTLFSETCILKDTLCSNAAEVKQKIIPTEITCLSDNKLECNRQQLNVFKDAPVSYSEESLKCIDDDERTKQVKNATEARNNATKDISTPESCQKYHDDLSLSDESSTKIVGNLQMINTHHSISDSPVNQYPANDDKYVNETLSSFYQASNSINSLHGLFQSNSDNVTTEIVEEGSTSPLRSNCLALVSNKSQGTSLLSDFTSSNFSAMIMPMSLRLLCVEEVSRLPNGLKLMLDWGLATIDELDLRIKSQLNIESALLLPVVNAAAPQAPPHPPHQRSAAAAKVADTTRAFHGTQGWLSVQAFGPYFVCLSPSQQRSLQLPHVSAERAAALLDMHCKVSRRRAYYEPKYTGLHQEQRLKTTVLSDWLTYAKSDNRREQSPLTRFEKIDGDDNLHATTSPPVITNSIRDIARKFEAQRYHISKQRDIAVEIQGQNVETNVKNDNEGISKNMTSSVSCTTSNENDVFRAKMYSGHEQQMAEHAMWRQNKHLPTPNSANPTPEAMQLEVLAEFANRARTRMEKLGLTEEDDPEVTPKAALSEFPKPMVTTEGGATQQLKRIQEDSAQRSLDDNAAMPVLAPTFKATAPKPGVWSPETRRAASAKAGAYEQTLDDSGQTRTPSAGDEPPPAPVWTPKSSPTLERKEFRPVRFETTSPPVRNTPPDYTRPVSPPFDLSPIVLSNSKDKASNTISSSLDRKLTLNISRLPRAQNPTVTLLQKAREGQLPRGALYLDHKMSSKEMQGASSSSNGASKHGPVGQGDIVYAVKSETVNEDKKVVELAPKKYDGIGPTTKEGIPIVLRSGIKEENYGKWYKRMYDSLHKAGRDDDHITIRYRPNRRGYPYSAAGGYASEPEPAASYDSDIGYSAKYATLDRRRIRNKDGDFTTSTMPRSKYMAPSVKYACEVYKNQPGRIEDYEPGHSSISENEAKLWWEEVMDIFDGQHIERNASNSTGGKPFMTYALKESGYESDSQLVFKRRENGIDSDISPTEHKVAYKSIQSGGDVPLHGLRKPAPERPKDDTEIEYFPISPTLTRIRVHRPRHQVPSFLYYPVKAFTTTPVFSTFKRTARSCKNAPLPPQRRSSRHNDTLRIWTRFTPKTQGPNVRLLRERLSCRLGARSPSGSPSKIPMGTTTRSSTVLLPRSRDEKALRLSVSVSPRGRELLNSNVTSMTTIPLSVSARKETTQRNMSPSPVRPPSALSLRHAECKRNDAKKIVKSSAAAPSSLARPKSVVKEDTRRAKEACNKIKERAKKEAGNTKSKTKTEEVKKNIASESILSGENFKSNLKSKNKLNIKRSLQKDTEIPPCDRFLKNFQHDHGRNLHMSRSSSVLDRAHRYTQTRRTTLRPTFDSSLRIFLTQRRPVSQSPFRMLDVVRSLSQIPTLPPLPPSSQKQRSASEPPIVHSMHDVAGNIKPTTVSKSLLRVESPVSETQSREHSPVPHSLQSARFHIRCNTPTRTRSQSPLSSRNPKYLEYMLEVKHAMPKSARFKKLARLYSSLERIGQLQRTTASCSDLHRSVGREPREVKFDRWWRDRTREKAEKELRMLYGELRAAQKEHLFDFKVPSRSIWKPDSSLRCRDRSVEDLRAKFLDIAARNGQTELHATKMRDLVSSKDNYKPLWRGSSVLNLAEGWNDKHPRSRSAGSVGHCWSSLSLQQLNTLKNNLSDIYGSIRSLQTQAASSSKDSKTLDFEVSVLPKQLKPKEPLRVRRNSLLTRDQLYSPVVKRKEANRSASLKADSVSAIPCSRPAVLSESEKKRLSTSLSQEILDRVKNTKKSPVTTTKRSSTKISNVTVKSSIPVAKSKSIDRKYDNKAIKDNSGTQRAQIDSPQPKKLSTCQASKISSKVQSVSPSPSELSPRTCYSLDLSDASTMSTQASRNNFLLVLAPSAPQQSRRDMRKAVEEWASNKSVTLRPASETESASSGTSNKTVIYRGPIRNLNASQSCSDLKELFGERARPPLPMLTNTLCRQRKSRSTSPNLKFYSCAPGEVRRLTEKFERCSSDPDLTIQTKQGKRHATIRNASPTIPAKPRRFKAEDRFVSRVNIISKMAALQRRSSELGVDQGLEKLLKLDRVARENARKRRCLSGDVENIRRRFEERHSLSLLGQMFTSTPDIRELSSIAPIYFTNQSTLSTNQKKAGSSPDLTNKILKQKITTGAFENQYFDPEIHRAKYTYQPRHHQKPVARGSIRSVTFKDPLVRPAYYQEYNSGQESPHKFVEGGEVTIHYRSPVRGLARDSALSEEELARRQEEAMRLIYQEERRRKYLQELHDMESRRHTDNFTPSQKSPIPLNRYDDYFEDLPSGRCHERTPEPKMVARALYNFVGQTPRELTFRRGDIIIVRRQIDKNWYEGEHNASIGLFPFNYIEIIPYDGVRTLPKRATEGKARAKFNFVAQTHLELSLIKGENVVLTRRVDDNWYEGRIGARKGIFPVSYVEVLQEPGERLEAPISQKPVASPASHSLLLNCSASSPSNRSLSQFNTYTPSKNYSQHGCSSGLTTSSGKQIAPVDQALHIDTHSDPVPYRALYNYKPQNDDELELHEGDIVFVMEKCDDGWYVGSSNQSGHFGTFPGNYVERV